MRFVVHQPSAALAPFVQSMWLFEAELAHARERVLPSGQMQLLVNLAEDELRAWRGEDFSRLDRVRGAAMTSAYDRAVAIDTAEQRRIVGVVFHPGGARPFLSCPASALRGMDVGLEELWGVAGRRVRERLLEAGDAPAIFHVLESILHEQRDRALELDGAIAFAVRAFEGDAPVGEVSERLGVSPRRFIAAFRDQVGLTPKRYARVRRFHRVLGRVDAGRGVRWADVAVECGYYDQAHLIRDFRAFAGLRPSEYAPRSADERAHVILPD